MDNLVQMEWANAAGLWVGFIFTLLIFSALLGDHLLARLAQYVLVGAVLGYAVVVTWQSILASDVATSLRTAPQEKPWNWIPVLLAVVMTIAGLERIFAPGRAPSRQSAAWGRGLRARRDSGAGAGFHRCSGYARGRSARNAGATVFVCSP